MTEQQEIINKLNEQELVIVCPSRSRAGNVKTLALIPDLVLIVNSNQNEQYKLSHPDVIVLSPPDHIKGITPTRTWILENFNNFFMVDDDVVKVSRNHACLDEEPAIYDPEMIKEVIYYSYYISKKIGAKIFGFPSTRNPLNYNSHTPFGFTGYFNNSHVGFLEGHNLLYSNEYGEAEDYYISCLNAYQNRYGFFDRRFTFQTKDNFVGEGGCCEYRTIEMMKENTLKLRKTFGECVYIKQKTTTKGYIHEGERTITIPF